MKDLKKKKVVNKIAFIINHRMPLLSSETTANPVGRFLFPWFHKNWNDLRVSQLYLLFSADDSENWLTPFWEIENQCVSAIFWKSRNVSSVLGGEKNKLLYILGYFESKADFNILIVIHQLHGDVSQDFSQRKQPMNNFPWIGTISHNSWLFGENVVKKSE